MKVAEVAVLFEDEEVVFRVNDGFSFEALSDNVCRYFELNPLEGELVDDEDVPWPQDALVADELAKYDNQYGRVILKHLEGKLERERLEQEEYIRRLEEDESSSEEEDEDAAVQPAAAAAAGADGEPIELSGADAAAAARVEMLKGMKKSKKQLRAELQREVPFFAFFWVIFMVRAMMQANRVASVFFQTNAIRVALVEEETAAKAIAESWWKPFDPEMEVGLEEIVQELQMMSPKSGRSWSPKSTSRSLTTMSSRMREVIEADSMGFTLPSATTTTSRSPPTSRRKKVAGPQPRGWVTISKDGKELVGQRPRLNAGERRRYLELWASRENADRRQKAYSTMVTAQSTAMSRRPSRASARHTRTRLRQTLAALPLRLAACTLARSMRRARS